MRLGLQRKQEVGTTLAVVVACNYEDPGIGGVETGLRGKGLLSPTLYSNEGEGAAAEAFDESLNSTAVEAGLG
jgi:hypothetical protein